MLIKCFLDLIQELFGNRSKSLVLVPYKIKIGSEFWGKWPENQVTFFCVFCVDQIFKG